jgi:hypothetical protein
MSGVLEMSDRNEIYATHRKTRHHLRVRVIMTESFPFFGDEKDKEASPDKLLLVPSLASRLFILGYLYCSSSHFNSTSSETKHTPPPQDRYPSLGVFGSC